MLGTVVIREVSMLRLGVVVALEGSLAKGKKYLNCLRGCIGLTVGYVSVDTILDLATFSKILAACTL